MASNETKPSFASRHVEAVRGLIKRNFEVEAGNLVFDGRRITDRVAESGGTPCYFYSRRLVHRAWHTLRAAYPSAFRILYSMKANPHSEIIRYLVAQGAGIEVASAGELTAAIHSGCAPRRIVFAGPGKTDMELRLAIEKVLGEIHVESMGEVKRLARLSSQQTQSVKISLRVNPLPPIAGPSAIRMGGRPSPFGIDEDQLDAVVREVARHPQLDLVGLHLNVGTQLLDTATIVQQYRYAGDLARRLGRQQPGAARVVNLGGGLGIPYFPGQSPLDLEELHTQLQMWWDEIEQDDLLAHTQWVIEPGRFLVGEAGIYVASVVDVKESQGERFVVMNGGMHHHLAASGNFGQTVKRPFPLAVANRLAEPHERVSTLVGPLCTPLDTLGRNVLLPDCRAGDLVAIFQSGAYAMTASPVNFLGHSPPREVWVTEGDVQ